MPAPRDHTERGREIEPESAQGEQSSHLLSSRSN